MHATPEFAQGEKGLLSAVTPLLVQQSPATACQQSACAMQGSDDGNELSEVMSVFLRNWHLGGSWMMATFMLPECFGTPICLLRSIFSSQHARTCKAWDVARAAAQQMGRAYAARHPELSIDQDFLKSTVPGVSQMPLPANAVPRERSLIAVLLQAMSACAIS
jgi:hypothetical protein